MASKYGNVKTMVGNRKFDSQAEAARYKELVLLEKAGEISGLKCQYSIELVPAVKFLDAIRTKPAARYYADFCYWEKGVVIYEDVKSPASMTAVFQLKRHILKALNNIDLRITGLPKKPSAVRKKKAVAA